MLLFRVYKPWRTSYSHVDFVSFSICYSASFKLQCQRQYPNISCHSQAASQYYVRRCGLLLQTESEQRGLSVCLYVTVVVSPAKPAEPIEMPFGLWTRVGRRKQMFNRIRKVAPMCPNVRAHWRNLTNTIEPSVCGGDAVLFQITLTKSCFCVHSIIQNYTIIHR